MDTQAASPPSSWSLFKPATWKGGKKVKVGVLGTQLQLYYDAELKKWMERGGEGVAEEHAGDANCGPPPSMQPQAFSIARRSRGVSARYASDPNLKTSSSSSSSSSMDVACMLPPRPHAPPAAGGSSAFFLPVLSYDASAQSHVGADSCMAAPHGPAPSMVTSDAMTNAGTGSAATTQGSTLSAELPCDEAPAAPLGRTASDPAVQRQPVDGGRPTAAACSEPGSKALHNGRKFSLLPYAAAAAPSDAAAAASLPGVTPFWGNWQSAPNSTCGSSRGNSDGGAGDDNSFVGSGARDSNCGLLSVSAAGPSSAAVPSGAARAPWGKDRSFDAAMHPGVAAKLDGPLPWELPPRLKYSDGFVSICTTWQRNNPGCLYSPHMLLPPLQPKALAATAASLALEQGPVCPPGMSTYLKQVMHGVDSHTVAPAPPALMTAAPAPTSAQAMLPAPPPRLLHQVPDATLGRARQLLACLVVDPSLPLSEQASAAATPSSSSPSASSSDLPSLGRGPTPTKQQQQGSGGACSASSVGAAAATPDRCTDVPRASSTLQTPQREPPPAASPYLLTERSPTEHGHGQLATRSNQTSLAAGKPSSSLQLQQQQQHDPALPDFVAQLAALKRELQEEYEKRLAAKTSEIELRFETALAAMRREVEAEWQRRLAERDAQLSDQRQRCAELQDDLDHLLLCLGQESRKVTDLATAMRDAGLDAEAITTSIEDEYALMDLPSTPVAAGNAV